MERRLVRKTGIIFLVVALATILVSGGLLAACSTAQTSTATTTATAVSAADFYKDKILTIIVPTSPGGGTDYGGRLFASFWTEITGGAATVKNVVAADGLVGVNNGYSAKPDGLTVVCSMIESHLLTPTLNQNPAVAYDIKKMQWIGWMNRVGTDAVGVSVKSPVASVDDLKNSVGFKFASSGIDSSGTNCAAIVIDALQLKNAGIVTGFAGSSDVALAVGRGEVDGYVMNYFNIVDNMKKGFVKKPLLLVDLVNNKSFPEVPPISSLVKLSPQQESFVRLISALDASGQVFWVQPGVPQDRVAFLRDAFDKINALDGFKKLAILRWEAVAPIPGKDVVDEMGKIQAVATPEKVKELRALAVKYLR